MSHEIAAILRAARKARGIGQQDLADQTFVPLEDIQRLEEQGEVRSIARLRRLARFFELDFDALGRGEREPSREPSVFFRQRGQPDFFESDREIVASQVCSGSALVAVNRILGRSRNYRQEFLARPPGKVPYREGYAAARLARRKLGNTMNPLPDLQAVIEEEFETPLCVCELRSTRIEAVTARDPRGEGVVVVLNQARVALDLASPVLRRTLAHELAHVLLDIEEEKLGYIVDHAQEAARKVGTKPPTEQRADAFAAEFLVPEAGVRKRQGAPRLPVAFEVARRLVEETEREFGAPRELTIWHLWNLGYLDEPSREQLFMLPLPDLPSSTTPLRPMVNGYPQIVVERLREGHEQHLITAGGARELLELTAWDEAPWEDRTATP